MQAARLTSLKGQRDTIEAAALLAREGALDGAVVIFAGDAQDKDAYREELPNASRATDSKTRSDWSAIAPICQLPSSPRMSPWCRRLSRRLRANKYRSASHGLSGDRLQPRRATGDDRVGGGEPRREFTGWLVPAGEPNFTRRSHQSGARAFT